MEVDRRLRIGQFERQAGLTDLPRAKRRHRQSLGQSRHERGDESAGNHPCNHGMRLQKCKVVRRGSAVTAWMKFIHAVNRQAYGGTEGFLQERQSASNAHGASLGHGTSPLARASRQSSRS